MDTWVECEGCGRSLPTSESIRERVSFWRQDHRDGSERKTAHSSRLVAYWCEDCAKRRVREVDLDMP